MPYASLTRKKQYVKIGNREIGENTDKGAAACPKEKTPGCLAATGQTEKNSLTGNLQLLVGMRTECQ